MLSRLNFLALVRGGGGGGGAGGGGASAAAAAGDALGLVLGQDPAAAGLSLASSDALHPSFGSPWASDPSPAEPAYATPACYRLMQPPTLSARHLQVFEPATLLYMFYSAPRDLYQCFAAEELHFRRGWRFHKSHKVWFKRDPITEDGQQFVYFDQGSWQEKVYSLGGQHPPAALTGGFLSDEELAGLTAAARGATAQAQAQHQQQQQQHQQQQRQ